MLVECGSWPKRFLMMSSNLWNSFKKKVAARSGLVVLKAANFLPIFIRVEGCLQIMSFWFVQIASREKNLQPSYSEFLRPYVYSRVSAPSSFFLSFFTFFFFF